MNKQNLRMQETQVSLGVNVMPAPQYPGAYQVLFASGCSMSGFVLPKDAAEAVLSAALRKLREVASGLYLGSLASQPLPDKPGVSEAELTALEEVAAAAEVCVTCDFDSDTDKQTLRAAVRKLQALREGKT